METIQSKATQTSHSPVTVWFRQLPGQRDWFYNHTEDCHTNSTVPKGTGSQKIMWQSSRWRPLLAFKHKDGKLYHPNGAVINLMDVK